MPPKKHPSKPALTVGFLGSGNMAGALILGLLEADAFPPSCILASDAKKERLAQLSKEYGIKTTTDNHALVRGSSIIVLSVKPQVVDKVLTVIGPDVRKDQLVISIAAGVPIAALALAGATAISAGTHATARDLKTASALFEAVGRVVTLDESLLDAVTGLSGSGPAYVMLIIDALADGGVKVGLHRDTALLLAAQTVFGAAKLQLDTGDHPGRLKDMVTSPGGTAIAGLHTLESGGLRRTLIDAVEVASLRAAALGEQMAAKMGVVKG
jgi:pyrroline-5-carboxylate reductase